MVRGRTGAVAVAGCVLLLASAGCTSRGGPAVVPAPVSAPVSAFRSGTPSPSPSSGGGAGVPDSAVPAGSFDGHPLFSWVAQFGNRCLGSPELPWFTCAGAGTGPLSAGPSLWTGSAAMFSGHWELTFRTDRERVTGVSCGALPVHVYELGSEQLAGGTRRYYALEEPFAVAGSLVAAVVRDGDGAAGAEPLDELAPAVVPGAVVQRC